jgi:hypothetical protein
VLLTFDHEADVTPNEGECMKENDGNMFSLSETPVEQPENRRGFEIRKRMFQTDIVFEQLFYKNRFF